MINLNELNFTKDNDEWYFEEYFSPITEFCESYSNLSGYVSVWVKQHDYDNETYLEKPHKYQENAFNYFVENTELVLNALCNGIIEYYPKMLQEYNLEDIPELKNLSLSTISDVKKTISIDVINIIGQSKDDFGYLGFSGRCPWDPEHGFGVVMHKDRVVKIEDADIADSNLDIIYEDKMSKEEWNAFNEEMEKNRVENLAKYEKEREEILRRENEERKASQQEEKKLEEKNIIKKWWQF
ncbi:DUF6985 domain-containing protein [Flavobacterium sp. SM2513]|uniref:DUF6985 domain-containing protein n=1 Tax=Flavobacterium sp. SM2513 TaxID=3424766 RepID=UPI003D7F5883